MSVNVAQVRTDETTPAMPGMPLVPSGMWRHLATRARPGKLPSGLDAAWNTMISWGVPMVPRQKRYMERAAAVLALEPTYHNLSDARLREAAFDMRDRFRLGRQTPDDVIRAFAIVREAAWRQLGMRPYQVQVAAAMAIADGNMVEMATGEGKTLSATMPATVAGWRGRGCHVITVNDYLAQRDADLMSPIYEFCGLKVAAVVGDTPPPERRLGYLADITYLTNKEVAADLLRDRLQMGRKLGLPRVLLSKMVDGHVGGADRLVMRGMEFAVVDEADSVLVDEAVTPLIISGGAPNEKQMEAFAQGAEMARALEPKVHYTVNQRFREIRLTPAGEEITAQRGEELGGIWVGARRREELIVQALTAKEMYQRDKHYVIQEDKVVIVDEFTGRLMPDRTWREGLHQAVEAKEGVEVSPVKETLARISFQRFFRMYRTLGGMTGTGIEAQHEMWQVYRRPVVPIPTHRPRIRVQLPDRIFTKAADKWKAIVEHIVEIHATGRPILIGTRSVHASEYLSQMLTDRELEHRVLNAVRHAEEAAIVALAGQEGKITVATNMAGRGTDIKLGRGVAEKGGLHVIATERHEDGRVDRQLFGRAGRQGDPGSAIAFSALDDELTQRHAPIWARSFMRRMSGTNQELKGKFTKYLVDHAQQRAAHMAFRQRKAVLKTDDWLDEFLGFAGVEH